MTMRYLLILSLLAFSLTGCITTTSRDGTTVTQLDRDTIFAAIQLYVADSQRVQQDATIAPEERAARLAELQQRIEQLRAQLAGVSGSGK